MNELLNHVHEQWAFALGLAVGFPALLVALNELAFALARAGRPVAGSVRFIRTWVVPLVALTLFLRWVVLLPESSLGVRLTETLCLTTAIVAIMGVINNLVFESARAGTWQSKVPRLLRDLLRLLLAAIGLAMVYSFVWGREIEGAIAALGVTSIVVGLALQEPLGNLFSGLMLLMERPFEVGDTIEVGSISGEVKEVNWRSAHIEALGGATQVVPNSTLNKETIVNFSRPRPKPHGVGRRPVQLPGSPLQGAPGSGRAATPDRRRPQEPETDRGDAWLRRLQRQLPPDLPHRGKRPVARQERVGHPHLVHGETPRLHNALPRARGPAAPEQERAFTSPQPEGADLLAQFPRLPEIPPEDRARTRPLTFGAGERLFDKGDALDGVYFVVSGTVSLQVVRDGQASEIATIQAGEFCGETGMHGHQAADMRAVALEDTAVVLIAPDVVRHLFEGSPRLARETGYTLEVHRKALQSARTALRQR